MQDYNITGHVFVALSTTNMELLMMKSAMQDVLEIFHLFVVAHFTILSTQLVVSKYSIKEKF